MRPIIAPDRHKPNRTHQVTDNEKGMRTVIVTVITVAILAIGAMAGIKSCTKTDCEGTCATDNTPAFTCKKTSDSNSFMYNCSDTTFVIESWTNTDCSGRVQSTFTVGKPGTCSNFGRGSFFATCTSSSDTPAPSKSSAGVATVIFAVVVAFAVTILS